MGWHNAFTRVSRADRALGWAHGMGRHLESGLNRVALIVIACGSGAHLETCRTRAMAFEVVVDRQTNAARSKSMDLRRPRRLGSRRGLPSRLDLDDGGRISPLPTQTVLLED